MDQEKLNSLQKDIDELNTMWTDAVDADLPLNPEQELEMKFLLFQEGELSPEESGELENLIAKDPEYLKAYYEFSVINSMLYNHFHPNRMDEILDSLFAAKANK